MKKYGIIAYTFFLKFSPILFIFFLLYGQIYAERSEVVTIYRDHWGVPHIYGDTQEAAAYGHGYAQAQDRLDDIFTVCFIARGQAAKAFGKTWVQRDYQTRVARHAEVAQSRYGDLSPESRRLIEYFVAGIGAYMAENPEEIPAWADELEPYHVLTIYRSFLWGWPWGQAMGDLKRMGSHVADGRGSNQWVIGSSRSAEGGSIALIDPHLIWKPMNLFYEAHVHGGGLNFYGFSIIGTPLMAMGHTDVLSISGTSGGPDCADVYEEKINPENSLQYEYEGEWHPISVEEVSIEVKHSNSMSIEKRRIERTHHGPIWRRKGNRAYAIKTAYDYEVGIVDQWLSMIKSNNFGDFLNAMKQNQSLPLNIMYADIYGNSYYIRGGRVPIRPGGFEWDKPVPGWMAQSEWLGTHPLSDLVQILNPPSGYMQNCNVSPNKMINDNFLKPDDYLSYIYNSRTESSNSRGRRALALLKANNNMTLLEAFNIALDTFVDDAQQWQKALVQSYELHRSKLPHLDGHIRLLSNWNGRMDIDSRAAALFRFWKRSCQQENLNVSKIAIETGKPLADDVQVTLLKALEDAVDEMKKKIGRTDILWGEVHLAQRGGKSWPVGGCRADGINTLRSVISSAPDEKGVSFVKGGQLCTTVVLLREKGITSYSVVPYGQSNHPDSPHFIDQGEKLFSKNQFKPTWYQKEDMLKNTKSQQILSVPKIEPQ